MAVSPCKECDERELGCHSYCIAYRRWKATHDKIVLLMHEDDMKTRDIERRSREGLWNKNSKLGK